MTEILKAGFKQWNIPFDELVLSRFDEYYHILSEKNKIMNLTAITNPSEAAALHFLDSLALFRAADIAGKRIIDIGSGAGFPGLPLKLADPEISLTLLDSHGKRVDFLKELTARLGAEDTECIQARAEEQATVPGYRDAYDFAVARAVAELRTLCELCLPFVKPGGAFLAMKSTESDDEISQSERAIHELGGRLMPNYDYVIPGTDIAHRVVRIKKDLPTPERYPRRFARIQKAPL